MPENQTEKENLCTTAQEHHDKLIELKQQFEAGLGLADAILHNKANNLKAEERAELLPKLEQLKQELETQEELYKISLLRVLEEPVYATINYNIRQLREDISDQERKDFFQEVSRLLGIREDQIHAGNMTEQQLQDPNHQIVYLAGNIIVLNERTAIDDIKFPDYVAGSLLLGKIEELKDRKLPNYVAGNLFLHSLTEASNLKLPDTVGGHLNLHSLTEASNLKLPDTVGGDLWLDNLTTAQNLKLPDVVGGYLDLQSLTTTKNLKLPNVVGGYLDLSSLTTASNLKLPDVVGEKIYFQDLPDDQMDELKNRYPQFRDKIEQYES